MATTTADKTTAATDQDPTTKPAAQPTQSGVDELNALLAKGQPDPQAVVSIIDAHRDERDAIIARLQQTLGNTYVQSVISAMGWRASLDRKEIVDGDPSNPNSDYFLASQAQGGAKWRADNGAFTGTVDKTGLNATEQVNPTTQVTEKVDAKAKTATVDLNKDGKTEAEAYGKYGGANSWDAGVKGNFNVGDGAATADASYTKTATGSTEQVATTFKDAKNTADATVGVKDGGVFGKADETYKIDDKSSVTGAVSGDKTSQTGSVDYKNGDLDAKASATHDATGTSEALTGTYTKGAITANAGLTSSTKDGLGGTASVTDKIDDKTTASGSVTANGKTTDEKADFSKTLANGATVSADGEVKTGGANGTSESLTGTYKDKNLTATGGVTHDDKGFGATGSVTDKINDNLTATGSLTTGASGTDVKAGVTDKLSNGAAVTANGEVKTGGGTTNETLSGTYKDTHDDAALSLGNDSKKGVSVDGSETHTFDNKDTLGGKFHYDPTLTSGSITGKATDGNNTLTGSGSYSDSKTAGKQLDLSLSDSYKLDPNLMATGSVDYKKGADNAFKASGEVDAKLGNGLYGSVYGDYTANAGKQDSYDAGASITFTKNETDAVTAAGLVNERGQVSARLEYDHFKTKIDGVSGLSDQKKSAMWGAYIEATTGGGSNSMMDQRYGTGDYNQSFGPGGNGVTVSAGIKFTF
ncbi:MAG TPA: hypothetical protein VGM88_13330 [Kofleriaceae bacterium]